MTKAWMGIGVAIFLIAAGEPMHAGGKVLGLPTPPGARRAGRTSPREAMEKCGLSEDATLCLSLAADLADDEGATYVAFKSGQPVPEVMRFYEEFARDNEMPDAFANVWDNSSGKEGPEKKRDSAGSISLALRDAKGVSYFSVIAFRPEKSRTTTVYVIVTKSSGQ